MSLADQTPHIVSFSLLLKCIFLSIIIVELALPKYKKYELKRSWSTTWESEMQSALIEGSSFLFSIGLLLVFDIIASDDSWIPLVVTIVFDILLVTMILYLLFYPKKYGITDSGIYRQGLILRWEHIVSIDPTKKRLKIKTEGIIREDRKYPLPEEEALREEVLVLVRQGIEDAGKSGTDDKINVEGARSESDESTDDPVEPELP